MTRRVSITRPASSRRPFFAAILIVAAVVLAWSNSLGVPFLLDDHDAVVGNDSLRRGLSFAWLFPAADRGETVSGRPLLNLSFVFNYKVGGLNVGSYHIANVLIHVAAALTLFGLVRRTSLARDEQPSGAGLALAVALLWALHPLHTGAVTYIAQRAESLAGVFYLLTLYGFVRGVRATRSNVRHRWLAGSIAACFLGVATKEIVATAPLLVLVYDRTFVARSWRAAWNARRGYYLGLATAWLLLAALVVGSSGRGGSAGFDAEIGAGAYFLTQCEAIVRYLALAFWPAGQVFDHGTLTVPGLSAVWLEFGLLVALASATAWALWRNLPVGFLGAGFFLLLAPSSSFVPVATQTIAEHRMYLPLVPVIVAVALLIRRSANRLAITPAARSALAWGGCGVLAVGLGTATWMRNELYRSEIALWQDTVTKQPANPRAHYNLGLALAREGRAEDATAEFRAAVTLQPNHAFAHFQLGTQFLQRGAFADAAEHLQAALAADPGYVDARINLGEALDRLGRRKEAAEHYRLALAAEPDAQDVRTNLAATLVAEGQFGEAEALLRQVLAAAPDLAEAHHHLGLLRERAGDLRGAVQALREALRLKPELAMAHFALGNVLAREGDLAGAATAYREALRHGPPTAAMHYAWGNLLAKSGQLDEAIASYRAALAIDPAHLPARNNLANALLMTRRIDDAVREYEEVLRRDPQNTAVRENLRHVLEARAQSR